jgi:hypothetical protein
MAAPAVASGQVTPAAGYNPPDDTQALRVGAVIFYDYTYQMEPKVTDATGNRVSFGSFQTIRAYINVTGTISHIVLFRITPDIARETATGTSAPSLTGSLVYRLKYGYAQFNLDDWMWRGTFARIGIQQTPYIDALEGIYRYRFQGTTYAERDGAQSSADAGISFRTAFPNNYGDVHFGYYNGEGYQRTEVNDQKSFQLRGTVRPLPNANGILRTWRLTGFMNNDHVFNGGDRKRFFFNTLVEHRRFNAGFDYMTGGTQATPTARKIDVDGFSFFITPFFKEKGNGPEALLRWDSTRTDTANDLRQNGFIGGVAYWFPHPGGNATAALLLDYEQVTFEGFTTAAPPKQQRIFVHGLISF